MADKPWRFDKQEYKHMKEAFAKRLNGSELNNEEFLYKEWLDFSTQKQDMKDIMFRAIMTVKSGNRNYLCYAFIVQHNQFTLEQLKDILFINSGLFHWSVWTDEFVDFVFELLKNGTMFDVRPTLLELAKGFDGAYRNMSVGIHRFARYYLEREEENRRWNILASAKQSYEAMRIVHTLSYKVDSLKSDLSDWKDELTTTQSKFRKSELRGLISKATDEVTTCKNKIQSSIEDSEIDKKAYYKALKKRNDPYGIFLTDRFCWYDLYWNQHHLGENFFMKECRNLFSDSELNRIKLEKEKKVAEYSS